MAKALQDAKAAAAGMANLLQANADTAVQDTAAQGSTGQVGNVADMASWTPDQWAAFFAANPAAASASKQAAGKVEAARSDLRDMRDRYDRHTSDLAKGIQGSIDALTAAAALVDQYNAAVDLLYDAQKAYREVKVTGNAAKTAKAKAQVTAAQDDLAARQGDAVLALNEFTKGGSLFAVARNTIRKGIDPIKPRKSSRRSRKQNWFGQFNWATRSAGGELRVHNGKKVNKTAGGTWPTSGCAFGFITDKTELCIEWQESEFVALCDQHNGVITADKYGDGQYGSDPCSFAGSGLTVVVDESRVRGDCGAPILCIVAGGIIPATVAPDSADAQLRAYIEAARERQGIELDSGSE